MHQISENGISISSSGFKGFRLLPSGRFGYSKEYVELALKDSLDKDCAIIKYLIFFPSNR